MSLKRGALVVIALAAMSTFTVPTASADEPNPVCAAPVQGGTYGSAVAGPGNGLWSQTSDGRAVSGGGFDSGSTPVCASPAQAAGVGVSQSGVSVGRTQSVNPGTPGQCTWGAAQKWFEASGSYPSLLGNALAWGDSAAAAGWTVVDTPRPRSIVVFQPGMAGATGYGHVAWVDAVTSRADGAWLRITEMNNVSLGGPGIFNQRDVKAITGLRYILLP